MPTLFVLFCVSYTGFGLDKSGTTVLGDAQVFTAIAKARAA